MSDPAPATGQTYRMPPREIADLVDAPLTPDVAVSPDRRWMVLMDRPPLPAIADLAQPELRLAGLRINPRTNGPSRARHYRAFTIKQIDDGRETPVTGLSDSPRLGRPSASPDAAWVAFTVTRDEGVELWVASTATGQARGPLATGLNAAHVRPHVWLPDSQALVCVLAPPDRGDAPEAPAVPAGPVIQENVGKTAPARTYQDLLQGPHDEALFEHYLTAQLAHVTLNGSATSLGPPGLIADVEPSPDGQLLRVEAVQRPYSYLVPIDRFAFRVEVWDREGRVVHVAADVPLAEEVPIARDAARPGPRGFGWRSDAPATLSWVEAQDGGDPKVDVAVRDKLLMHPAPFTDEPAALAELGYRFAGLRWGSDELAWVSEYWWQTRRLRHWAVGPGKPGAEPRQLFDLSSEDRYHDPGMPMMRLTPEGASVMLTANDGRTLFLAGAGASPEGDRPFLDELDLATGRTERRWRSVPPHYEQPLVLLDPGRLMTLRESKTVPPNFAVRDLRTDAIRVLTDFPDPAPQLAGVQKEQIRYKRADGVDLTATLYLPPGYCPDQGPLPTLLWAYPREFKTAAAASQVTDSPHRFVRISPHAPLFWLTQGYAILDGPTMPIVGEGDREPNDTYVDQLKAGAQAAVDEVARRGVTDPDRVAVGGHSYGAFMTANLLAYTDLFRAGIARSGAYNRTLTPFGFQAEERTLWDAPEVYFAMSPFMHASKIESPLLLIHGQADNNSGTFPMQSERFYNALKGHGATARLAMLPEESHGYEARESVMHMLWEMHQWLERYVKNAEPRER